MVVDTEVQGSPGWMKARAGIPTASNCDKIVTTAGVASKSAKKYLYQLAAERIRGIKEETYQNAAMKRGIEFEVEARAMYAFITDQEVEVVGLCYPDEKKLCGASPDGLVGDEGIIEIKCPSSDIHVDYFLRGVLPTDYFQQTQMQLFVTGRKWVDFVSYFPGLKPLIVRAIPDTKFITALRVELEMFYQQLDEVTAKLRGE